MFSPNKRDDESLCQYFKSIFHIYKSCHGYISRYAITSMTDLPLILSDRIFYSILEAKKNACLIHKSIAIENLTKFYLGNKQYQQTKIVAFLDKESTGFIRKTDVEVLILYFQTFLNQQPVEQSQIQEIICSVFQGKETVQYRDDFNAFLKEQQNQKMLNLFYYFLLKITPIDEYPQYLDLDKSKKGCNSPLRGPTKNMGNPLSYQCNSHLSNYFENNNNESCETEVILFELDNDWFQENEEMVEYEIRNINKDDDSCSSESTSRSKKKNLSFELRKMSSTSLCYLEEDNLNLFRKTMSFTSLNLNFKEHTLFYQEEDGLNQYKFIVTANYIYYSQQKHKKIAIPMMYSYTSDIKQKTIKSKSYFQISLICLYLFHNLTIELYAKSKDDLEAFAMEINQYSHYKPINEEYEFVEKIGKGNFSTVYLGISKRTQIKVAIKAIEKKSVYNNKQFEMLQNEYDIFYFLCRSTHKNIAKGIEFFSSLDHLYFVYEYLPKKFVELKNSKIETSKLLHYIKEILNGLAFLHSNGIIHRDIKPDNIMLDDSDTIKLIDLGLGTIITSSDSIMNNSCGTLLFTAPEIIMGKPYGTKCDIWSLGIIAHDYLYGYNPFEGKSIEEIAHKITNGLVDSNDDDVSNTTIGDLIKRCLVVDQDSRIDLSQIKQMLSSVY